MPCGSTAATAFGGAVITPYFDSLLVKITTWGQTLDEAVRRADRSLREFRIRGVKTNIPFLENLILHPTFLSRRRDDDVHRQHAGAVPLPRAARSRDQDPQLSRRRDRQRPAGRERQGRSGSELPSDAVPPRRPRGPAAAGHAAASLQKLGPEKFATWVREQKRLLFTDTTMRDAHQSLLATRVRTYDMLAIADAVAHRALPNLFSLEMWGGATFDTSMRFLQEDPWDRLVELRQRIPNILFQMLLRASNAVGYTNYPDNVVKAFIKKSGERGIDVFRIFDSLNSAPNMKVAMDAVRRHTDAICEAAICYTGDILDPARTKYSLKYYVKMAKELEQDGHAHPGHQGHGRPVQAVRGVSRWSRRCARKSTCRSISTRTTPAASTPRASCARPTRASTSPMRRSPR